MQKEYEAIMTNMAKLLEVQQKRELVAVDMLAAAIAAEREACAREAEKTFYSVQAAENIRARGNK
jgi:hypothetical protein